MSKILVQLQEVMGSDRMIAEAAWTSSTTYSGKTLKTEEDVKRVVNMLADAKHSVPFESVIFRFWIRLPIAIDRQLMTHRIASHSGLSGRYRTVPSDYLTFAQDVYEIIEKSSSSSEADNVEDIYNKTCAEANVIYRNKLTELKQAVSDKKITNDEYKRVREFLRGMLPQHNMTERVSIFNLRSFANLVKLRNKPDAQPEIKYMVELMLEAVEKLGVCPLAIEALKRNDWVI